MRVEKYRMPWAAYKRLYSLRSPQALTLPIDPHIIAPFSYRFAGGDLCLSYQERDLAYVTDHQDKDAILVFTYPQDDVVDNLMRRSLGRLVGHLNECNKIENAMKREEKAQKAQRRADLRAQRMIPEPVEHVDEIAEPAAARVNGFEQIRTEEGFPVIRVPFALIDKFDDIAYEVEGDLNSIHIDAIHRLHGSVWFIQKPHELGYDVRPDQDDENFLIMTPHEDNPIGIDPEKFIRELTTCVERHNRVTSEQSVRDALSILPEPEFSHSVAYKKSMELDYEQNHEFVFDGNVKITVNPDHVSLSIEEIPIFSSSTGKLVNFGIMEFYPPTAQHEGVVYNFPLRPGEREKLNSLWALGIAHLSNIDPDNFRPELRDIPEHFDDFDANGYDI